jgi:hypothetical protein
MNELTESVTPALQVDEPLKEWLRPCNRQFVSQYPHPNYVAVRFRRQGQGWDWDRIYDSPYSQRAWGCEGAIPRGTAHLLFGSWFAIQTEHLANLDPRWVQRIRRMPIESDYPAKNARR